MPISQSPAAIRREWEPGGNCVVVRGRAWGIAERDSAPKPLTSIPHTIPNASPMPPAADVGEGAPKRVGVETHNGVHRVVRGLVVVAVTTRSPGERVKPGRHVAGTLQHPLFSPSTTTPSSPTTCPTSPTTTRRREDHPAGSQAVGNVASSGNSRVRRVSRVRMGTSRFSTISNALSFSMRSRG